MLQESDMFMDALTASTKSKEPRKRKRRASITKDGPSETKKQEIVNSDNRESTPPPSPSNVEEKSPVALKPNFKVLGVQLCFRRFFRNSRLYCKKLVIHLFKVLSIAGHYFLPSFG